MRLGKRTRAPGAGEQRFEQWRQEAWTKEQALLERLRTLPDGEHKAEEAKRMIDRVRTFIGYRASNRQVESRGAERAFYERGVSGDPSAGFLAITNAGFRAIRNTNTIVRLGARFGVFRIA